MARISFLDPVTLRGNVVTPEPLHVDHHDGLVAGASDEMTTFMNPDHINARIEIGHTRNAASAQRSGTNAESKRLMLTHAFGTPWSFRSSRPNGRQCATNYDEG